MILKRVYFLYKLILIAFSVLGLTSCDSDPFPGVLLPVHPEAIGVNRMNDRPAKGAKAVAYHVSVEFPASKIIEFYNRELASMGYAPFNDTSSSRPSGLWSSFNNRSGKYDETTKPPGRYIAHWVDSAKSNLIWLGISYRYNGLDPTWKNTAMVSCNMAKYSAYKDSHWCPVKNQINSVGYDR
jgi:hypothetical protein